MSSATESLKGIHHLHVQLETAREELAKGPKLIAYKQRLIDNKKRELEQFLEELKQIKLAAERKNLDLKTLEKKLADLNLKLNTASSNREFNIIQGQIEADKVAISVMEDEVLELYEKADAHSSEVPVMETELEDSAAELKTFSAAFEEKSTELESTITRLQQELAVAEKVLPSEPLEKYRRLVASKGSRALAAATNGACSNCFVQLTPQQRILIKTENVLFCTNCGSMLYYDS